MKIIPENIDSQIITLLQMNFVVVEELKFEATENASRVMFNLIKVWKKIKMAFVYLFYVLFIYG